MVVENIPTGRAIQWDEDRIEQISQNDQEK
jgi:hypothetical protein